MNECQRDAWHLSRKRERDKPNKSVPVLGWLHDTRHGSAVPRCSVSVLPPVLCVASPVVHPWCTCPSKTARRWEQKSQLEPWWPCVSTVKSDRYVSFSSPLSTFWSVTQNLTGYCVSHASCAALFCHSQSPAHFLSMPASRSHETHLYLYTHGHAPVTRNHRTLLQVKWKTHVVPEKCGFHNSGTLGSKWLNCYHGLFTRTGLFSFLKWKL